MKTILLLIFTLTTQLIYAQNPESESELKFKTNEFYDISFPNKGEFSTKSHLVNWTLDFEEQAVLIEPAGTDPVLIFFDIDGFKNRVQDDIVVITINTERHELTLLIGPDNYHKVKLAFKMNMNNDGSYNEVFVYTNYYQNDIFKLLSNHHN